MNKRRKGRYWMYGMGIWKFETLTRLDTVLKNGMPTCEGKLLYQTTDDVNEEGGRRGVRRNKMSKLHTLIRYLPYLQYDN